MHVTIKAQLAATAQATADVHQEIRVNFGTTLILLRQLRSLVQVRTGSNAIQFCSVCTHVGLRI